MYSGTPLKKLIDRYADDRMIEAVATEAARGRLLLVATTDFATGEPVVWDLGSIALYGGHDARKLLRSVLLAAWPPYRDRKSTRLNSSHQISSYAVFCLKKTTTAPTPG